MSNIHAFKNQIYWNENNLNIKNKIIEKLVLGREREIDFGKIS